MKALYKTTIVIWSEYNPQEHGSDLESLAYDASRGESYCSRMESDLVSNPEEDDDWDGTEFFFSYSDEEGEDE